VGRLGKRLEAAELWTGQNRGSRFYEVPLRRGLRTMHGPWGWSLVHVPHITAAEGHATT